MEKREDPGDEVAATVSARSQRDANTAPPHPSPPATASSSFLKYVQIDAEFLLKLFTAEHLHVLISSLDRTLFCLIGKYDI